jgi:CO/xanthine dehydrogenase Mo-binding subunit
VAVVAADDRETARLGAAAIQVEYEPLPPLSDPEEAERIGSTFRLMNIVNDDGDARGEVVVEGYYEVGQQDQAPLGTESGLAIPDGEGGVDLHISTQWLHVDHEQVVATLGLPSRIRCGSTWPASVALSGHARTSASRSTSACWRSTPGAR